MAVAGRFADFLYLSNDFVTRFAQYVEQATGRDPQDTRRHVAHEPGCERGGDHAADQERGGDWRDVFLYFDNTDKLQAPKDALSLMRLLGQA